MIRLLSLNTIFDVYDINKDGKIDYNELVFVIKQFISSPDSYLFIDQQSLDSALMESGITPINDQTRAEFIASGTFYEIDQTKTNYLTPLEMQNIAIKQEWNRMKTSTNAYITYYNFRIEFFKSPVFRQMTIMINSAWSSFSGSVQNILNMQNNFNSQFGVWSNHYMIYNVHQLDYILSMFDTQSSTGTAVSLQTSARKPLFLPLLAVGVGLLPLIAFGARAAPSIHQKVKKCYDESQTVFELHRGLITLKDLGIGDLVFDGDDYTKIYHIQQYQFLETTVMNEIKFGNNSIIITPQHLLYLEGDDNTPIISDNVKIGDILSGKTFGLNNDDMINDNYTVYDIRIRFNRHPINPITMSGNLVVNNIKTSVFSHSAKEHKRLQECGAIFRFISSYINQHLASKLVSFYYNVIYKQLMNDQFKSLILDDKIFANTFIISLAIFIVYVTIKITNYAIRSKVKQISC